MPFGIGIWELLILLLVLLLVFGPKRLPEMGRQLGKGMREFKDSVTGDSKDDDDRVPAGRAAAGRARRARRATVARAGHRLLMPSTPDDPPAPPAPSWLRTKRRPSSST